MKIPATLLLTVALVLSTIAPSAMPVQGWAQPVSDAQTLVSVQTPPGSGATLAAPAVDIRVNAGGPAYSDGAGNVWLADKAYAAGTWGYASGTVYTNTAAIPGTSDPVLYQSQRSSPGSYRFDVANGVYEVELRFAEIYDNCSSCRNFNVKIAGVQVLTNFDPMKYVGRQRPLNTTFRANVTGNQLLIEFTGSLPIINALRVTSQAGQPPRNAVWLNSGGFDYTDGAGKVWVSDQAYVAGLQGYVGASSGVSSVTVPISRTNDQPLFQNNRYNMTGYTFDLANGMYSVDLLLAELYDGVRSPGVRVFDVWAEGARVLTDIDVFQLTTGSYLAVTPTFTVNVIDAQLNITFTKKASATQPPIVNAIAVRPLDMAAPGPWANFGPTGWQTTRTPAVHIEIQDTMSGLNVSSAQYAYSTNGGSSFSAWLPAALSGENGTTSVQTLSVAAVPFTQDSPTQNVVKFRVSDVSGNVSNSNLYVMQIDAAPPTVAITSPASGSVVSGAALMIQGSASDSGSGVQSVEVSTDDGAHWSTATGTGSWSYAWSIPGDGVYSIRARARDNVGLVQTPTPAVTVTVDSIAPVTFIRTPVSGQVISSTSFLITGTAYDATSGVKRVELSVDGGAQWITATGMTTWSYNWSPVGQGNYTIRARAVDQAGNVDNPGTAVMVAVDRVAPSSSITDPAPGRAVRGSSYTISGVASDGASGSGLDRVEISHDGVSWQAATGLATWTYLWDPLPADGSYTMYTRARDLAGNVQTPPFSLTVIVDNVAPASNEVVIGVTGDNGWYNSIVTFFVVASDASSGVRAIYSKIDAGSWLTYTGPIQFGDGSHSVSFYAVDQAGNTEATHTRALLVDTSAPTTTHALSATLGANNWYRSPVIVSLTADDATSGLRSTTYSLNGGPWTPYSGPITIVSQGMHDLLYRSIDVAGNTETVRSVSVQIDVIAPVATVTSPAAGQVVSGASMNIQGIATDGSGSGLANVEISINGSVWIPVLGSTTWSYPWTPPGPGLHNIRMRATDLAGNVQASDSGIYFTVDTVAPASSITSPYSGQIVPGPALLISGSSSDTYSSVSKVEVSTDAGVTWVTATLGNGGAWTYNWAIPNDGIYVLRSRATDQAGNVETPQGSVSVHVDSIAPTSLISDPTAGMYLSGSSYTVSGVASDVGSGVRRIEVSVDNGPWLLADGAEAWTFAWSLVSDGPHTLRSRATDSAGNIENPGAGVAVVVDNGKPASIIEIPSSGQVVTSPVLFIAGVSTDETSGVKRVEISLQRSIDGYYWTGSDWSFGETWLATEGSVTSWNYLWTDLPTVMMVTIRSRATDNMGNLETPGAGVTISIQRGYRTVLPLIISELEQ